MCVCMGEGGWEVGGHQNKFCVGVGTKTKERGNKREREKKTLAVIHEALSTLQVPTKAFTEIKHGTILDMRRDDQSACVSKCV